MIHVSMRYEREGERGLRDPKPREGRERDTHKRDPQKEVFNK